MTNPKALFYLALITLNSDALRLDIVFSIFGFKSFKIFLSLADNKPSVVSVAKSGALSKSL